MQQPARVASTPDGVTAFQQHALALDAVDNEFGRFSLASLGRLDATLFDFPPGYASPRHQTPLPAWLLVLSGAIELEVSGADARAFGAGALVRMEDATGEGHVIRTHGPDSAVVAMLMEPAE